jgi:hypothetical protein
MIFSGRVTNYFGFMTFNALQQSPACRPLRCSAGDKHYAILKIIKTLYVTKSSLSGKE